MKKSIIFLLPLLFTFLNANATEWHVVVNGSAYNYNSPYDESKQGTGTMEHPWSLEFALSNPKNPEQPNQNWVKPGDIIWVHEGRYMGYFEKKKLKLSPRDTIGCNIRKCDVLNKTEFDVPQEYTSYLEGDSAHPIIVRAWKEGNVILDGDIIFDKLKYWECSYCAAFKHIHNIIPTEMLLIKGKYVTFWGIEITTSNTPHSNIYRGQKNYVVEDTLSFFKEGTGILMQGLGIKLINMVVYGMGKVAIGDFSINQESEVQGCMMFNNGYSTKTEGWGHAIYAANETSRWKKYYNNIAFNQFGLGIKVFLNDRKKGTIKNFIIENNITFNNGVLFKYPDPNITYEKCDPNIHVGGHANKEDIFIRNNHCYRNINLNDPKLSSNGVNMQLYAAMTQDTLKRITVENNYLIGGYSNLELSNIRESNIKNNTFLAVQNIEYDKNIANATFSKYSDFFIPISGNGVPMYNVRKDLKINRDFNKYLYTVDHTPEQKLFYFLYRNPDTSNHKRLLLGTQFSIADWQKYGMDEHSKFIAITDTKMKQSEIPFIFVLDNDKDNYNPGRKHIVIYNLFGNLDANNYLYDISTELGKYIPMGSDYVMKDVQNYHVSATFIKGNFSETTKIFANLSPNKSVEIPLLRNGELPAGMRVPRHTCPQYIVYTIDFFPYEVNIQKEDLPNSKTKITANIIAKGKYFQFEKFEYSWENADGNSNGKEIILNNKSTIDKIVLVIKDINTGMSIRKKLQ